jgi:hypothetical protein
VGGNGVKGRAGRTPCGIDEHEDSTFSLLFGDQLSRPEQVGSDLVVPPYVRDTGRVRSRRVELVHLCP